MYLDPAHLIENAQTSLDRTQAGSPRLVDLRRAAATAYYAVFHSLCAAAAEAFGRTSWAARVLFYRAVDHGKAGSRCSELAAAPLRADLQAALGRAHFGTEMRNFGDAFRELQSLRNNCDYNPDFRITKADAQEAIYAASAGVANLGRAEAEERALFIAYVLLGRRS